MAGTVIIPWYATGFRADGFEEALGEVAAIALRYGATSYAVYRPRDDRYRFQQLAAFEEHIDWERYLGRPRDDLLPRHALELVPGPGALRLVGPHRQRRRRRGGRRRGQQRPRQRRRTAPPERPSQPCSSGAIVRPAPLSCSQ